MIIVVRLLEAGVNRMFLDHFLCMTSSSWVALFHDNCVTDVITGMLSGLYYVLVNVCTFLG